MRIYEIRSEVFGLGKKDMDYAEAIKRQLT